MSKAMNYFNDFMDTKMREALSIVDIDHDASVLRLIQGLLPKSAVLNIDKMDPRRFMRRYRTISHGPSRRTGKTGWAIRQLVGSSSTLLIVPNKNAKEDVLKRIEESNPGLSTEGRLFTASEVRKMCHAHQAPPIDPALVIIDDGLITLSSYNVSIYIWLDMVRNYNRVILSLG